MKEGNPHVCVTHPSGNSNDAGKTGPPLRGIRPPPPIKIYTSILTGRPARNVQNLLRGHAGGGDRDTTLLRQ